MYVLVCLFLEPISRSKDPVNIKIGSVLCLRTPVPETEDIYIYIPLRGTFFEDVPPVEFMHFVFTCMPGESYCRCSGLCCVYVRCLSSAN